ncbi:MAG: ferritin-like domain-containing protein [Gemmatimonadota bacterium]|nr:MAG: ferritin-like domain-containing protein [Gemmatimonadota bacterium]
MDKLKLIENLNGDLAGALGAIVQRLTYAAKTTNRYGQRITEYFLSEIPGIQARAQILAKRIVALGGEPTTVARGVPQANTNREMVEAVLASEKNAIHDFTRHQREAEEISDKMLATELGDMIRQESVQAARTERILRDWPI